MDFFPWYLLITSSCDLQKIEVFPIIAMKITVSVRLFLRNNIHIVFSFSSEYHTSELVWKSIADQSNRELSM